MPVLVAVFFVLVIVLAPEWAVALTIAAFFGLFPEMLLPRLPFLGGTLAAEDLAVMTLLLVLVVRHMGKITARLSFLRAYLFPFLLLSAAVVVSVYVALGTHSAPRKDVLNEARPFVAWLILPICALAIDTPKHLRRFLWLLLFLGLLLSCGVIFQSVTGMQILSKGQFLQLGTLGERHRDVLRSTTPGMFLIGALLIFLIASHAIIGLRRPWLGLLAGTVLSGGLLVGFGRGIWVSVFLGLAIVAGLSWNLRYARLMILVAVAGSLGVTVGLMVKPESVQVIVERLLSIGTEIQVGESYGRRKTENEYAWKHIVNSPMLGVGLGGEYKPPSAQSIAWPGETRYIHNTYVNVATKMGVPALLALVALVTTMLVRGWTTIRIASSADRPIAVASFWTIMAAAVVTSLTQPNLISPGGAVSLAVAVFLTECVRARVQTKTKSSRVDIGAEVGE